jgi:aminocarboxymuconate-semialdehyde decarboxylase
VPITLVDWAPAAEADRFLAAQNDRLAEVAAGSGGRFLALGAVPLQDTDLAVAEMLRLRHQLGMAGVEISAMVDGRELDDPSLDEFWAAAAAEQVPIFIHPAHQDSAIRRTGQPIEFGLGMLTDTALAVSALIYGGVLERHPGLRIALSHGCGTFPWVHPRMRYMAVMGSPDPDRGPQLDALLRSLWVDCLVFDPSHLGLLVERFGADHLMYGTDHPFLPEGFDGPRQVIEAAMERCLGVTTDCLGANALRFLGLSAS